MGNKKKRPKIHRDALGQFRWQLYFVNGKQRREKVRLIDGMEVDDFIRKNADDAWLLQEGYYDILHERDRATRSRPSTRPSSCEQLARRGALLTPQRTRHRRCLSDAPRGRRLPGLA